jgi:hypothetical protein
MKRESKESLGGSDQSQKLPEGTDKLARASIINNNGMSPTQRPTVDPNYVQTSPELINHIIDRVIKDLSNIDNPVEDTMPEIHNLTLDTVI